MTGSEELVMLEFGAPCHIASIDGKATTSIERKLMPSVLHATHGSRTIIGHATRYWAPHVWNGKVECFADSCFSGREDRLVHFQINHDRDLKVGDTRSGLSLLMNDPEGLAFEFQCPESELGDQALGMIVKGGGHAGMSVGYSVVADLWKKIRGQDMRILVDCLLEEISIVGVGAVPGAFATVPIMLPAGSTKSIDAAAIKVRFAAKSFLEAAARLGTS